MSLTGEVLRASLGKKKTGRVVTTNRKKSAEVIVADKVKKKKIGSR